jgi:hypothetical protein
MPEKNACGTEAGKFPLSPAMAADVPLRPSIALQQASGLMKVGRAHLVLRGNRAILGFRGHRQRLI